MPKKNASKRLDHEKEQGNSAQQAKRALDEVKSRRSRAPDAPDPDLQFYLHHRMVTLQLMDAPGTSSRSSGKKALPARVTHPNRPPRATERQPDPAPKSCSPTSSDIDALEESFLELDITSTRTERGTHWDSKGSSSQNASSASHRRKRARRPRAASLSPSASLEDLPTYMSRSIADRLPLIWPKPPQGLEDAPVAVLWEVTRVALECDVDMNRLALQYDETWKAQDTFWAALKSHRAFKNQRLPPRSDPRSWQLALANNFELDGEAVLFTITMRLSLNAKVGPPLRLELHPLKREQSSRLFRKFGADRFLELRVPAIESWPRVGAKEKDLEVVAARWLASANHRFLGRRWAGFYVRDHQQKVEMAAGSRGLESRSVFYDRVLLFAEEGNDLSPPSAALGARAGDAAVTAGRSPRIACSREEMLDWLLNLEQNEGQSYLKLFHRVVLGLSQTVPVVVLEQHQIRHQDTDLKSVHGEVMNDGAGRISPSLMRKVRDALGLQSTPSAIQGRLGSSKGMWLVDPADASNADWIETYPAQRKWVCADAADAAHRTLEVRSWSTPLSAASLNIQFLPILEDRARDPAAMRATFVRNMAHAAEAEVAELKDALQHTERFRKWARESAGQAGAAQRLLQRAVPFLGGLPDGFEDIMHFLVDGGFAPLRLQFLQDLAFHTQRARGEKAKQELKIRVARSTYAYMLVDFWGVLAPGEVHLAFSSAFEDGTDELTDLDGVDVLVGRSPAHLPSDLQKVRAVFKPALRHLKDVVIFSAQDAVPLAAMLSGGDYDGDRAWVCWDPDIVDNFTNHPLPAKPDFSAFLNKDKTTLGDLRREFGAGGYVDAMIEKAFCFNLRQKLLGPCTAYKEKLVYHGHAVSSPTTITLSWLLSELADQPKQGVLFPSSSWARLRNSLLHPAAHKASLAPPAYKTGALPAHPSPDQHVIDHLMTHARRVVDGSLTALHAFLRDSGAASRDAAVERYWDAFERAVGDLSSARTGQRPRCGWFVALREGLRADVDACLREWNALMGPGGSGFREGVVRVFAAWRAVQPRLPAAGERGAEAAVVGLVRKLLVGCGGGGEGDKGKGGGGALVPELSPWELLKASWAFKHHHQRRFVWQMAGRQIQALKALSCGAGANTAWPGGRDGDGGGGGGGGVPVLVVANMYAALKPDHTYIKRLVALEGDGEGDEVASEQSTGAGMAGLVWSLSQQLEGGGGGMLGDC